MTSGALDVTDSNMSAPLLARSINELLFAVISAVAFTTVLGTVSGLIMAASGAVAHDLMSNVLKIPMDEFRKVAAAKVAALGVGMIAIVLGILFAKMNVNFLVGWAFNIAASANLPSLIMLLFWKRTTKQGITTAIVVGMISSLGWILLSAQAYKDVYGWNPGDALVPFSQPAIVTIAIRHLHDVGHNQRIARRILARPLPKRQRLRVNADGRTRLRRDVHIRGTDAWCDKDRDLLIVVRINQLMVLFGKFHRNLRDFSQRQSRIDTNDFQRPRQPRQVLLEPKQLAAKRAQLLGDRHTLDKARVKDAHRRLRQRNPAAIQIGQRLTRLEERFTHRLYFATASAADSAAALVASGCQST
jgi:hypothetical protein